MASIPYFVKNARLNMSEIELSTMLLNESFEGYELCTVLTKVDEGSSELNATYVFKRNIELIFTNFDVKDAEEIPDRYMTAEQIRLIKDLGKMELNGENYKVSDIVISFNPDEDSFFATIKLEPHKKVAKGMEILK